MNEMETNFLKDLITLLKEDALKAKKEYEKNKSKKSKDFYLGVLHGHWKVLTVLKDQLIAFQISPEEVKFDIDPDKDLLGMKGDKWIKKQTKNK